MDTNYSVVAVSLGSNFGDRSGNVARALDWLSGQMIDCRCSHIYETAEVSGLGSPYMNAVLLGRTSSDRDSLVAATKDYELVNGRTPESRGRGEVAIDIDIVVWDGSVERPVDFSREFFRIGYRAVRGVDLGI